MTELAGIERALTVIAAAVVVQTFVLLAAVVWASLAYRRLSTSVAREVTGLRATVDEVSRTVRRAADAIGRSSDVVTSAVDDARNAAETVGAWTGTVATAIRTPRAAAAIGVLRGIQWWRSRRARQRPDDARDAAIDHRLTL